MRFLCLLCLLELFRSIIVVISVYHCRKFLWNFAPHSCDMVIKYINLFFIKGGSADKRHNPENSDTKLGLTLINAEWYSLRAYPESAKIQSILNIRKTLQSEELENYFHKIGHNHISWRGNSESVHLVNKKFRPPASVPLIKKYIQTHMAVTFTEQRGSFRKRPLKHAIQRWF